MAVHDSPAVKEMDINPVRVRFDRIARVIESRVRVGQYPLSLYTQAPGPPPER